MNTEIRIGSTWWPCDIIRRNAKTMIVKVYKTSDKNPLKTDIFFIKRKNGMVREDRLSPATKNIKED